MAWFVFAQHSYVEFTDCSSVTRTQQRCSIVVLQASGLCNAQLSLPIAAADYDDSYAVNSASQGPWGDAIMHELLPEIESRFREPIECCGNLAALRCPNGSSDGCAVRWDWRGLGALHIRREHGRLGGTRRAGDTH